jgi:hypothetical protein
MEFKVPTRNPFAQNAHDKAQDAIDRAREIRERTLAGRGKTKAEPHLIPDGKLLRCSVCSYPMQPDEKPSVSVAFADHLLNAHRLHMPVVIA